MSKEDGRFSTVIRSELREDFFKLENKGTIINDLISDYLVDHHKKRPNLTQWETQAKPSPQTTVVPQTVLDPLVCNYKGCGKRMVDMRAMANHRRNTGHGDVV